jgi:hypothetical protein
MPGKPGMFSFAEHRYKFAKIEKIPGPGMKSRVFYFGKYLSGGKNE